MLFPQSTYVERRRRLRELVGNGLIVLFGNNDSPLNYPANAYKFRQDSSFLYFFGQKRDGLVGVIDADSGEEILVGDEIDIAADEFERIMEEFSAFDGIPVQIWIALDEGHRIGK